MRLANFRDYAIIIFLIFVSYNSPHSFLSEPSIKTIVKEKIITEQIEIPCPDHLSKNIAFKLLNSTVRVQGANSIGSGVVLWSGVGSIESQTYHTYIITNKHVVGKATKLMVEKFTYLEQRGIQAMTTFQANVLATSDNPDLAILEIKTNYLIEGAISMAFGESLKLYDSLFTVGCPLGNPPMITQGHVVGIQENLIVSSAFQIFGNSGGGNFLPDGKLIGISSRVSGTRIGGKKGIDIPVGNLALLIPVKDVAIWLWGLNMEFIIGEEFGSFDEYILSRE